jgi:hypothetical protein
LAGPYAAGKPHRRSPRTHPSRSLGHFASGHQRPSHPNVPPTSVMLSATLVLLVLQHAPRLPQTRR